MIFIAIEGPDGVGKSSLSTALAEHFNLNQIPCIYTREPGGSALGEEVRGLLKRYGCTEMGLNPWERLCLLAAARSHHVRTVIEPALHKGQMVICDRFLDSTYIYQGILEGMPRDHIDTVMGPALNGLCPQLVLMLTLDADERKKRLTTRHTLEEKDYYKSEAYLQKVDQAMLQLEGPYPCGKTPVRTQIDVSGSRHAVLATATEVILNFLQQSRSAPC